MGVPGEYDTHVGSGEVRAERSPVLQLDGRGEPGGRRQRRMVGVGQTVDTGAPLAVIVDKVEER
jgi:hypothetical protein